MTSAVSLREREPSAARPAGRAAVRGDIQGLRALAVSLVVIFHFWPRRLTGGYIGVDVFFVISGFLISSHLLAHPPRTVTDLGRFWSRRARRLLPASLLVLTATLVVSRLAAPALQWSQTAHEAIAAAVYSENWSLASQALDYLGADTQATPVQHFWSLSVEEQFYLAWPVLIALATLAAPRLRRSASALVLTAFGVVLAVSLVASVHLTRTSPASAYFVTWTRAWEFAVGGAAAWLVLHRSRFLRDSAVAAWVGLGAIALSAVTYTGSTPFPGWTAAVPVVGTALVLLARSESAAGPGRLWRVPGVRWLGDISYSVYLWHWPMLLLAPYVLGVRLAWPVKLAVLVVAVVLSGLTKVFVEDRFRTAPKGQPLRRTYIAAAAGMAGVALLGTLQLAEVSHRDGAARVALNRAAAAPCFGAATLLDGPGRCPARPATALVPDLSIAGEDKSDAYADSCFVGAPYTARLTCTYGHGRTKVALVGNSHAGHWLPGLQRVAEQNGWTITTYLVSVCNVSDAATSLPTVTMKQACSAYSRWVYDQTRGHRFDLVLTSERQSATVPGATWATTEAASARGYARYLRRWTAGGARVVVLKDPVSPTATVGRVPECLSKNPGDRSRCTWPHDQPRPASAGAYRWMDPLTDAAREQRVPVVDLDDLLCPGGTCQPAIGGVVTFFDASHLTATYARTLAPALRDRIAKALA